MAWRPSTATVTVVAIAIALVGNVATNTVSVDEAWTWWPTVVWMAVGLLTMVAVAIEMMRQRPGGRLSMLRDSDVADLPVIVDRLAAVVRKQWRDEITRHALNDPYPLSIKWEPAPVDLVADWTDVARLAARGSGWRRGDHSWADSADHLAENGQNLVEVWRKVPTGRLVVLGEPGAGKTMLLARFVIDLLDPAARVPGDPVPILVSIASWNPDERSLRAWLGERLAVDHPALRRERNIGRSLVESLFDNGLIIMILDGLDEIPESLRGRALARLNQELDHGQPLILSSRTDAYRAATRPLDGVEVTLTGAPGIRLLPVDVSEFVAYLRSSSGGPNRKRRWDGVASSVADGGVLAEVLATPLMAMLARTIYNTSSGHHTADGVAHPDELLRLRDRTAIEQHLFDGFIAASYRLHPNRRLRWHPDDAAKWLGYLAYHLERDQRGSTDLAWWRLHLLKTPMMPSKWFIIATCGALAAGSGIAAGVFYSSVYFRPVTWALAPIAALSVGLVFCIVMWLTGRFDAALSSSAIVAISSGLAIDLGGDLYLNAPWTQPSLLISVGLAAGFAYPLRARLPSAQKAGAMTAIATFVLLTPLYGNIPEYPVGFYFSVRDGVLAGTLVLIVMMCATARSGEVTSIARTGPFALTSVCVIVVSAWLFIPVENTGDVHWSWYASTRSISVLSLILIFSLIIRIDNLTLARRGTGIAIALLAIAMLTARQALDTASISDCLIVAALAGIVMWITVAAPRRHRTVYRGYGTGQHQRDWITTPRFAALGFGFVNGVYNTPHYGLAVGLVVGLTVELTARRQASGNPALALRFTRRGFALATTVCVGAIMLLSAREFTIREAGIMGVIIGMAVGVAYGMDAPSMIAPVRSPRQVLTQDRTTFLVCFAGVVIAAVVAIGFTAGMGTNFHGHSAAVGGATYGLATGALVAASRTQWLHYTANRLGLALRGHIPLAFMKFLADAHTVHGVLRQEGASYQFRHLDMQRRLASTYAQRTARR
ncbi:NACHT domain-containing protein [Actinosynnema sp. NPDC050801]|uniref:NACHT domain-containing protein n=1 Tax=unclassified Actinosynnema TaxID=2637065 RepID=UPI0033E5854C